MPLNLASAFALTLRAGLGQMAETIARDPFYQGRPGYEGMLNDVSRVDQPSVKLTATESSRPSRNSV